MSTDTQGSLEGLQFEQQLAQLEQLVRQLEQGDLPLEQALVAFEQGNRLVNACRGQLAQAELKVEEIIRAQEATAQDEERDTRDFSVE